MGSSWPPIGHSRFGDALVGDIRKNSHLINHVAMDNEKRAFNAGASGKYTSYKDWKNQQVESTINFDDILRVVEVWNEESNSRGDLGGANKPKEGSPGARIIAKRLQEYGLEACVKCVKNYSEVLSSSFFFSYTWDIRTFFTRQGAYAEFMDNGSKYMSYKKWRADNPLKITQINEKERAAFNQLVEIQLDAIIKANAPEDYNVKAIKAQIYPVVFCGAAKNKEIVVNESCQNPYSRSTFVPKFEDIIITGENNTIKKISGYERRYNDYVNRTWTRAKQTSKNLKA